MSLPIISTPRPIALTPSPISPEAAAKYREAIAAVTDQPVKYVVYSHAHWDHARGGQIFKDEGATFVAQERCVDNIAESPNPDIVPPDETFTDSYTVSLGDKALDLRDDLISKFDPDSRWVRLP